MSNITPLKTEAEQALIAQGASVAPDRKAAFARFVESGLPHRRVEAYHYTDLRALLKVHRLRRKRVARLPSLRHLRISTRM